MKRKVNINRKPLASEEINATKDFASLATAVGGASQVSPKPNGNSTGWLIGGIAAVAIAAGIYLGTKDSTTPIQDTNQVAAVTQPDSVEQTPTINPLLAEVDIKNESYKVDADKGGKIKHHTGTEITIPEGAFMDEDGNVVTGEVEVQYREFHDQADIFLSGIPMDYDSAGTESVFESAGMLEIRGFKDGKRLKIVPEKNFVICMHSKNPDPKFNLYYLDEEKKKWDYEGKDSITQEPEVEYNDFTIAQEPTTRPIKKSEIILDDSTNVNVKVISNNKDEIEIAEEKVKIIKKEIKTIKKTEPKKPIKADPKKKNFTIDVVKSEFPELITYAGTIFEVIDNKDLPEDTYSVTWNGVKLKEKNSNYSIELSKDERTEEIAVIPVLDGKNYEEAKSIFDSKFGEYKTKLANKSEEEKVAEEKLKQLKATFTKQKEEYEKSLQEMKKTMTATQQGSFEMQRVFNIRKFGTWNCDSPVQPPKGMLVMAKYIDQESGEEVRFKRLDLIESNRNACFPLDFIRSVKLSYNPRRTNFLWGITENGMIAVAKQDQFEKIEKGQRKHTFNMTLIDITGKSTKEIKQLISS